MGLLNRLIVQPFYRRHAGVFLLLLFADFGAVQRVALLKYHLAIMNALTGYAWLTLLLLVGWSAYAARVTGWCRQIIHAPAGRFLHQLRVLGAGRQSIAFLSVLLQMLAPLLLYAVLLFLFAVRAQRWMAAAVIVLFCIGAPALSLRSLRSAVNNASVERRRWWPRLPVLRKPWWSWPLLGILRGNPRNYFLIKLFALLMIYIPLVWNRDRYEHDSLPLFLILLTAANCFLALLLQRFLEGPLRFLRNLPLSAGVRAALLYATIALLLLPEAGYLLWAGRGLIPYFQIFAIWLVPVHTSFFFSAVLLGGGDRGDAGKALGGVCFVSLFFFNSEAYLAWAAVLLAAGVFLYFYNWPRAERVVGELISAPEMK